jgi:glutathione S-transferase
MEGFYPHTTLATVLALLIYVWTGMVVGKARKAHGVPVPRTDGPEAFQRVWRAHMNTLEQIVLFLPLLWLFAITVSDVWAALTGLAWSLGRVLYVNGYAKAAEKRSLGFGIGMAAALVCLIGTVFVAVRQILALMA